MNRIDPPDVYVEETRTPKGRGNFAGRDFAEGEIVEVAPVTILLDGRKGLPMLVKQRTFAWGELTGLEDGTEALVWGYGSFYNHANPANLSYVADPYDHVIRYLADRDIKKGEELTINYNSEGGGPVSVNDRWFERHGLESI